MQANAPLIFFVFFLLIVAAARGKLVWNSLPARQKWLRLGVLGTAIAWAAIRTYWVARHAASF
jgi:hypothetical protein